jgi:hypothetical protein
MSKLSTTDHPSLPSKPAGPLPPKFGGGGRGFGSSAGPTHGSHATAGNNAYSRPAVAAPYTSAYQQNYSPTISAPAVSTSYQQAYSATVSAPAAPPSYVSQPSPSSYGGANYQQAYQQQQTYPQQPAAYQSSASYGTYPGATPSAPQILNPFAPPTQGGGVGGAKGAGNNAYDPEWEAAAAQWNQNYIKADESSVSKGGFGKKDQIGNANTIPLGQRGAQLSTQELAAVAPSGNSRAAAVVAGPDGKQKTVVRSGGGKSWQDTSLLEWDPAHPRIFIGNLAGEVTDDSLLKAFSAYESVQKARVVRDRRTTKSRGYGFVSFSNSDDYFRAAKEMQGKYVGSHPILIKRSTTEIKATKQPPKGGKGGMGKGGNNNKHGKGGGGLDATAGAGTGAGVKKNKKATMVNGMKLLG